MQTETEDNLPIQCRLQRYGSRTFMYWYSSLVNDPSLGLSGTNSAVDGDCICVTQKIHGSYFCVATVCVSKQKRTLRTIGKHAAESLFEPATAHSLIAYATVALGKTEEEAKTNATAKLKDAVSVSYEEMYTEHASAWAAFWQKSYVVLPKEQDFLENLWYLNLYYANSEMKGNYPAHFCNGIWGAYYDYVPWNCYFHYNGQLSAFPLETANHPELTTTYYNFRFSQLGKAKSFSKKVKNNKGAFYTDVCDFKGRLVLNTQDNCTCGSQIAMGAYQHYLYSQDKEFLQNTALNGRKTNKNN